MKPQIVSRKVILQKIILLLILLSPSLTLFAQQREINLVPNPSFEKHKNKLADIKNAIPWQGIGTVDYYLKTDKTDTSRYKGAHTGTCYAGLRFQIKYKEYMYVKLTEPLQQDRVYHFKMYVRLMGVSTVVIKQLGVYFSDNAFEEGMHFDKSGILDSISGKGITGTFAWSPIQGDYVAHGGEQYIVIGNFTTKTKDDFVNVKKWDLFDLKEAYYFIDDISVIKTLVASDSANAPKPIEKKIVYTLPDTFTTGQIIELKNLQFENGTAEFKHNSYKVLEELIRALNNHPFMEIQINGHTGSEENEAANKKLSKARAKAVYDYLISQGVISPMTYKGFGASQPIAPNDTKENKAKNSRVEFTVTKQ